MDNDRSIAAIETSACAAVSFDIYHVSVEDRVISGLVGSGRTCGSPCGQAIAQARSSPMQPHFGGGFTDVKFLRNFAMTQAMHIAQHDDIAEPFGKIVQRSSKPLTNSAILKSELGVIGLTVIS